MQAKYLRSVYKSTHIVHLKCLLKINKIISYIVFPFFIVDRRRRASDF